MGVESFYLFFISAMIFILTPGIDTVYVLNKSLCQGWKSGVYSSLGISGGIIVHTLFAALGLSVILAKSAVVFSVIKYLGAVYLVYLGIKAFCSKNNMMVSEGFGKKDESNWKCFQTGIITNILNPKVALFFLSFFPQFISPNSIESSLPFLTLGLTYAFLGLLWFSFLACFSSLFSKKIKGNIWFNRWLSKISGIVFIGMGLRIALTRK